MTLAKAVGVDVPRFELVSRSDVSGVPDELLETGDTVLAVDRFDRKPGGTRVHFEDFAQISGGVGDRKYTHGNEESVVRIATVLGGGGAAPYLQALKRVAVNILMGNTDAHLKNWSIWYPEPNQGRLSPAYDILAYAVYDHSDEMALPFRSTRNSTKMGQKRFMRMAGYLGMSERRTMKELRETVEAAADIWPSLLKDSPMPEKYRAALIERTHRLALVSEFGVTFDPSEYTSSGINP